MKTLFVLDDKNYTDDMPVVQKTAVRAVIRRADLLAVQEGPEGLCKILGGGVEEGESEFEALCREVLEESGLVVIPQTIEEFGEILEIREDVFEKGVKYVCKTRVYFCDVEKTQECDNRTQSEISQGLVLAWKTPEEFIAANREFLWKPWIKRDVMLIQELQKGMKENE